MSEGTEKIAAGRGRRPSLVRRVLSHGLTGRVIWVLFLVAFYQSGLVATVWVMEPENFRGGVDWLWLGLFPLLLPLFFVINRRFGCASGACSINAKGTNAQLPPGH